MVYVAFALFFDVLIIPFLRDSTSLKDTVRTDAPKAMLGPTSCYPRHRLLAGSCVGQ